MATLNLIRLADHGQRVSDEEFETADFEPGYKYELIDGRLYVSAEPDMPEDLLVSWLRRKLEFYGDVHPETIGYVSPRSRVFVPGRRRTTVPEPDLAVYDRLPLNTPISELNWRNVSPILVAEGMRVSEPYKDLVRNVELYLQVSTIREYWILDARDLADEPTLLVYRRRGKHWQKPREIGYRESYTTPLLPGFKLVVDPRR